MRISDWSSDVCSSDLEAMVDRYWELLRFPGNREATSLRATLDREPEMADRIGAITAPTLILFGKHDRPINPSAAQTFHERIAGAEAVLLVGIGHLPVEEAPDATAAAIAEFLKRRLAAPRAGPETPGPAHQPPRRGGRGGGATPA